MYDQHMLVDEEAVDALIAAASFTKEDIVFEIGAGSGNITKRIAPLVKKVIAVEIDDTFQPALRSLPENVEVVFGDALKMLKDKQYQFTKIIANLPFQLSEPVMQYLCFAKQVAVTVLFVPKHFAHAFQQHPVFSAFLSCEIVQSIPPDAFVPVPRADIVLLRIIHRSEYEQDKDTHAFVRRKLFMQETKKVRNALRDTLIILYTAKHNKKLPKKEAADSVASLHIDRALLDTRIARMPIEEYTKLADKIVAATKQ